MTIGIGQQRFFSAAVGVPPFSTVRRRPWARRRFSTRWAVIPLFLLDAVCIVFSMAAAYLLRFQLLEYYASLSEVFYVHLAWIAIPMWLLIFAFYRLYHPDYLFGGMREYVNVVNACTTGLVGLILYSFMSRRFGYDISRGWLAMVWFLSVASVSLTRFGYWSTTCGGRACSFGGRWWWVPMRRDGR